MHTYKPTLLLRTHTHIHNHKYFETYYHDVLCYSYVLSKISTIQIIKILQSFIFKLFCDATTTADATTIADAIYKIVIFK